MLKRCYSLFYRTIAMGLLVLSLIACDKNEPELKPKPEPEPELPTDPTLIDSSSVDASKIYIPQEFRSMNFYQKTSQWSYARSRQSEHFIVFWDKGYGTNDPGSSETAQAYRVDIDDLLTKAEEFYEINVTALKFAEPGSSKLDHYKMMIFLFYQTEWLATGSGYDDTIGALWVSPNTCQPVGATIAHEIGHSFQYQVFADLGNGAGFRYGFGGNGGNGFWEQTAQWQAHQSYPEQNFTSFDFTVYTENYHRHVHHELYRYASYFIHEYWADKHGLDIIGRIWREAKQPEDPIQAYMRITNISTDALNDEIYDAATRFVTWDLDALRSYGEDYIGLHKFGSTKLDDGSHRVSYEFAPGTTGYNVIRLNVPDAGTQISADFTGLVNEAGYNQVNDPGRAGWRYGYVALLNDGSRTYSDMSSGTTNTVTFTVPENCSKLWFVVTGAPGSYMPHAWDEDQTNDDQWPYKVKFSNTNIYGEVIFDGTEEPADLTLIYDVDFPYSETEYIGATHQLDAGDLAKVAEAFVLQPSEILSKLEQEIKFYAVESSGALNATTTANGYGHWFSSNGDVTNWGGSAAVFSEFSESAWTFTLGQYPAQTVPSTTYTIKQALVYEHDPGQFVQATFVFNITIE